MPTPLARAFSLLDAFRELPSYQLERRVDALLAVYLVDVVSQRLGVALDARMVPELPLRAALLDPTSTAPNSSKKVDFFLIAADRTRAFLVELKTDPRSRNGEQDAYLKTAVSLGLPRILEGIVALAQASNANGRVKYMRLLRMLEEFGLVTAPADTERLVRERKRTARARLGDVRVIAPPIPLEVLYVQPHATPGDRAITFADFAAYLSAKDDELSVLLRGALVRWASSPAAQERPS